MAKLSEREEKIKTAIQLLAEETTTLDKFQKISTLVKGINPTIDQHLERSQKLIEKIQKIQGGGVISLSLEELPEKTKKQKKRKKLLLLLLGHWKDLRSEVERINDLKVSKSKAVKSAKILTTLKGPLGLITIAAAGVVAVSSILNNKAVNVTIKNLGCKPIQPISSQVINIPGLKLPATTINSGGQDVAKIPGLNIKVAINQGGVNLSVLGLSRSYNLPGEIKDIIYDGQSLMGKTTQINLGSAKKHEVIIRCN